MTDEAFGDAVYETWRRGGNPDAVERDRVDELREMGLDRFDIADSIASELTRRRVEENEDGQ